MYRLRDSSEQHELKTRAGSDRWLVSYSDYITLLFALFVLLYALGLQEKSQFERVVKSLSTMFQSGNGSEHIESVPLVFKDLTLADQQAKQRVYSPAPINSIAKETTENSAVTESVPDESMVEIQRQINKVLLDLVESGLAKVALDQNWLTVELNSGLLFSSGSAKATSSAEAVIQELVPLLNQTTNYIRVRGYTDSLSIRTESFPSNWELSAARSASIVRLLEIFGITPQRMAIEGYGEYSPFGDNETVQGRQQNRKVVIALSKFAYQPAKEKTQQSDPAETVKQSSTEEQAVEQEQQKMRVIRLPHGGIRITTRPPEPGEEEPPIPK